MFKFDQKGVSLPIVMIIAGIVGANIYYFAQLDKDATYNAAVQSSASAELSEKRRLTSLLTDTNVCSDPLNFGGKALANLVEPTASPTTSIGFPLQTGGITFLAVGGQYVSKSKIAGNPADDVNTHTVVSYYLKDQSTPANPIPSVEKRYALMVRYSISDKNLTQSINNNPNITTAAGQSNTNVQYKKFVTIKIPLYLQLSAGNIVKCYASETSLSVETILENACMGNNALITNSDDGNKVSCEHKLVAQSCGAGNVLKGMSLVASEQQFSCGAITGSCSTSPIQQFTGTVNTDGSLTCSAPDNGCAAGTALIMNGGTPTCTTNCAATYIFNSFAASGIPVCYERFKPCPAGQFTSTVSSDGSVTCADIVYKNKDCGAGNYATDMNPTTPGNPLTCTAYSKTKACAAPSSVTYVTSFTSVAPACKTFTF